MLPARRPYEDELACSAVLRCSRQFNIPIKRLGRVYFGRTHWRPSFLAGGALPELARLFRMTAEDLLWNHTAFPYASALMPPEAFERAIANALGEAEDARGLGAVTQNASSGLAFRRYCPECVANERSRLQDSYWHRSHNLPGVWVCLQHACYLWTSKLPISSSGPLDKQMPHEIAGLPLGKGRPPERLMHVSQISQGWLNRARTAGAVIDTYRDIAVSNDWLSTDRPVAQEQMTTCLLATFSRDFLINCGLPETGDAWATLMLQPANGVPFVPVKHALILALLGRPRPPDLPRLDHFSPGPPKSASSVVDAFYAAQAKSKLRGAIASGRLYTTEQFLRTAGCWGAYKHRKADLPKLRAVVREFRGSTATVRAMRPGQTLFRLTHGDHDG